MPLLLALYLDPAHNEHMIQVSFLPSIVCTIDELTTLKFQIYEQVHLSYMVGHQWLKLLAISSFQYASLGPAR